MDAFSRLYATITDPSAGRRDDPFSAIVAEPMAPGFGRIDDPEVQSDYKFYLDTGLEAIADRLYGVALKMYRVESLHEIVQLMYSMATSAIEIKRLDKSEISRVRERAFSLNRKVLYIESQVETINEKLESLIGIYPLVITKDDIRYVRLELPPIIRRWKSSYKSAESYLVGTKGAAVKMGSALELLSCEACAATGAEVPIWHSARTNALVCSCVCRDRLEAQQRTSRKK